MIENLASDIERRGCLEDRVESAAQMVGIDGHAELNLKHIGQVLVTEMEVGWATPMA